MTSRSVQNRPFRFGERDRREFIVQDSEVSLVAINDDAGNPIFLGRSKAGELLGEPKWQIRQITYDDSGGVTRVEWAVNDDGAASTDYEFIWSSFAELTITAITRANPAVVTVSSIGSLQNGDEILIQGVEGMEEVNFDGTNIYIVANISGATFQLLGINSSAYGIYSSGGEVNYGEFITYDYA